MEERVEGKKTPLLVDTETGVKCQLIVQVMSSSYSNSGTIIATSGAQVGMYFVEVS